MVFTVARWLRLIGRKRDCYYTWSEVMVGSPVDRPFRSARGAELFEVQYQGTKTEGMCRGMSKKANDTFGGSLGGAYRWGGLLAVMLCYDPVSASRPAVLR